MNAMLEKKLIADKPWIKVRALQDVISKMPDATNAAIAEAALQTMNEQDVLEAVAYAVSHLRTTVYKKFGMEGDSGGQKTRAVAKQAPISDPKIAEESRKLKKELYEEGLRRLAAKVLNMTGKEVRAIQNAKADAFAGVGDDQIVGEVLSPDQVMEILK